MPEPHSGAVCHTPDRCSEQHSYGPGCLLATPPYRLFVRHLARHVVWPNVLIIWLLLVLLVWGNPRWWAGPLIGLVVVPVSAVQAHLLGCSIPKDVAANADSSKEQ